MSDIEKTNPFNRLLKNIAEDKEFVPAGSGNATVYLTPYLSLIIAILYMMAADGEISEHECDHLLSVVGGDNQVLQRALRYIDVNTVDDFFAEAPSVVVDENRLCVLLNVCDSSMSDGDFDKSEMILFSRMQGIFGQNKHTFKPYFDTISIKNKHSVLEDYEKSADAALTPPLALAATMLYMMSVDGDIAQEEIAQLNISIRKFKNLLPTALKYVKQVKFHDFIKLANPILTHQQKLCILINVCDCMLADGRIDRLEQDLFRRMLAGFEINAQNFNKHFQNLSLKNEKPGDIRKASKTEVQGETIINSINSEDSRQFADAGGEFSKNNVKAPLTDELKNKFGSEISKKLSSYSDRSDLQNQLESEVDIISQNASALEKEDESVNSLPGSQNAEKIPGKDKKHAKNTPAGRAKSSDNNADGPSDQRQLRDSIGGSEKKQYKTADGPSDQRQLHDTTSGSEKKHYRRADGPTNLRQMRDADGADVLEIERDAAFDRSQTDKSEIEAGPFHARMDYLKVWTNKLKNNLDKFETINIHHSIKRSTGLHLIALKPDYPPALALLLANQANGFNKHRHAQAISHNINANNIPMNDTNLSIANESDQVLIQNRSRLKLAVITTGLIIAQGFTNYGLNESQSSLMINQAMTSNTQVLVESASIQQTTLNLTADLMDKTQLANGSALDDAIDKNKNNSEKYRSEAQKKETAPQTNDGKKELKEKMVALESISATQLIKLKWFGLANSALMLGFFMSFFGLLFRSKMSVAGSTSMFAIGTLLTINGFYLVI